MVLERACPTWMKLKEARGDGVGSLLVCSVDGGNISMEYIQSRAENRWKKCE